MKITKDIDDLTLDLNEDKRKEIRDIVKENRLIAIFSGASLGLIIIFNYILRSGLCN